MKLNRQQKMTLMQQEDFRTPMETTYTGSSRTHGIQAGAIMVLVSSTSQKVSACVE